MSSTVYPWLPLVATEITASSQLAFNGGVHLGERFRLPFGAQAAGDLLKIGAGKALTWDGRSGDGHQYNYAKKRLKTRACATPLRLHCSIYG
jgi:hypothetical protein